ncbi:hypothetical protein Dsin_015900 [Dipteronia sinensis]|uniref:RNase H type-1 domain-containing protein n=1 Tax=Dipteronia sinensis TaxID=43782 RepID=A0AAE0AC59_9ROSI|nr:hypothetical protein Dsin_015900 [Dipteronia sinensis]
MRGYTGEPETAASLRPGDGDGDGRQKLTVAGAMGDLARRSTALTTAWPPSRLVAAVNDLDTDELKLFCVIIWRVWFVRNCSTHDSSSQDIFNVVWWSKKYLAELQSLRTDKVPRPLSGRRGEATWKPPDSGSFKINCDADVDASRHRIGIGIVIRDDSGFVMASCSQRVVATFDAQVAETLAIYRGIIFGKDCCLAPCVIESDAVNEFLKEAIWILVVAPSFLI